MRGINSAALALILWGGASFAQAGSVAGVCPDGSAFIVTKRADAPCARAKFVSDPSELPPLRPELLPRPYTSQIQHEAQDPNNPYNLLDQAEKIRALQRDGRPLSEATAPAPVSAAPPGPVAAAQPDRARPVALALHQDELRDLVRLVALRQQVAPATFAVTDIQREEELFVRLAYSSAFEERVRDSIGARDFHVILFSARSVQPSEFHPNFFFVKDGATFRPDPQNPHEIGLLVGDPGELEAGYLVLGYLLVPERFDPRTGLEIWWNDRSIHSVLEP